MPFWDSLFFLLLPVLVLETQTVGIFGHSPLGGVGCTVWKFSVDLDCDVQNSVRVLRKDCDDFIGNLYKTHLGGGCRNYR